MTCIPYRTPEGLLDLTSLPVAALSAEVLADALSKVNRFNGRTPWPWSVASHSVLVAMLCSPRARALGLLHDAHEAFIGDITTPAVDLIASYADQPIFVRPALRSTKNMLDARIFDAWGLSPSKEEVDEVKQWDAVACQAEMVHFFGAEPEPAECTVGLARALDLLAELPSVRDWRMAKSAWIGFAQDLASIGHLRLPGGVKQSRAGEALT